MSLWQDKKQGHVAVLILRVNGPTSRSGTEGCLPCVYSLWYNLRGVLVNNARVRLAEPLLSEMGPWMGVPQCRLSILRNANVPCRYFRNVPDDFEIA